MGRAKERWMERQKQGWQSIGPKSVCVRCFEDHAIKSFVSTRAREHVCSYCGRKARKPIAAPMDEVIGFIAAGLNIEYRDPIHGVRGESTEGGYPPGDLLRTLGFADGPRRLYEDLCRAFSQHDWVQVNPCGERPCDALRDTWEAFAAQVKHQTRFVFFRLESPKRMSWKPEPHGILDSLDLITKEVGLVRDVPENTVFYRVRQHSEKHLPRGAKDLGAPPPARAGNSRMSPAGIPMLYVAGDRQTACAEVLTDDPLLPMITTARFVNLRELRVLDLSKIPDVPSLFDQQECHLRMYLFFMHEFTREISTPIDVSSKPYDYVPTQVITEYFRHLFTEEAGRHIDGIAYCSSKKPGGICYTLFFEQANCVDSAGDENGVMLLKGARRERRVFDG